MVALANTVNKQHCVLIINQQSKLSVQSLWQFQLLFCIGSSCRYIPWSCLGEWTRSIPTNLLCPFIGVIGLSPDGPGDFSMPHTAFDRCEALSYVRHAAASQVGSCWSWRGYATQCICLWLHACPCTNIYSIDLIQDVFHMLDLHRGS